MRPSRDAALGTAAALGAFLVWGGVPIYFKAVAHVPPLEVLAHRVLWSAVLLAAWLGLAGRLGRVREALRGRGNRGALALTSILIAGNWLIYIWAVQADRVLEASLGYFINPLLNVLLGRMVLGERLRRGQAVAVGIAALSVLYLTLDFGRLPWVALALAGSFGLYGLVRKTAGVDAVGGLLVESLALLPAAIGFVAYLALTGKSSFLTGDPSTDVLLVAAGVVTAVPLALFVAGARRLPLTAVGFIQYIAPTLQLLLAVFAYGEPFTPTHRLAFAGIWTALAIFTTDSLRPLAAGAQDLAVTSQNAPGRRTPSGT